METKNKTCCVFGHRKITGKEELKVRLSEIFEKLIVCENVDTFLVGSRSEFDSLCREILSQKRKIHQHIKRIYVRAEYPDIDKDYENYLLQRCEETYFPQRVRNAGKAAYIERNYEMIDKSDFCVVYFKDNYLPPERKNSTQNLFCFQPKSGTAIAYLYALKRKKIIIDVAEYK